MQLGLKSSFFMNFRAPFSLKQNIDLSPLEGGGREGGREEGGREGWREGGRERQRST